MGIQVIWEESRGGMKKISTPNKGGGALKQIYTQHVTPKKVVGEAIFLFSVREWGSEHLILIRKFDERFMTFQQYFQTSS